MTARAYEKLQARTYTWTAPSLLAITTPHRWKSTLSDSHRQPLDMARDHAFSDEAAPMLGERDEDHPPPSKYWFQVQRPRTIVVLLSFVVLLLSMAASLMTVPTTRILEDALCHIHYDVEGTAEIDEKLCKDDAIQSQLAYLNGLITMLEAVVGSYFRVGW